MSPSEMALITPDQLMACWEYMEAKLKASLA